MENNMTDPSETDEIARVQRRLNSCGNAITTKSVAKWMLEMSPIFSKGELFNVKAEHRGLGVYYVTLDQWQA